MPELLSGIRHLPEYLDRARQEALVGIIRNIVAEAPLYVPAVPGTGKPMSVRMTNCGSLGWVTDKARGYRYQPMHPVTGRPWPALPSELLEIWDVSRSRVRLSISLSILLNAAARSATSSLLVPGARRE